MREKVGKKYDPLVIEEFDWDNEWVDSLHVHIPSARESDAVDELTWLHVDEATGASQALQGRNLSRRAAPSLLLDIIVVQEMFLLLLKMEMEKKRKMKLKLKTHMMMRK
jgi:hypothetical protein